MTEPFTKVCPLNGNDDVCRENWCDPTSCAWATPHGECAIVEIQRFLFTIAAEIRYMNDHYEGGEE